MKKFLKYLLVIFFFFLLSDNLVYGFKKGEKGKHKKTQVKKKPDNYDPNEELKVQILTMPEQCPRKSKQGDKLTIHYSGFLPDGKMFDSSLVRNAPLDFILGSQSILPGWNGGLHSMCVGEKRKLIVPSRYAFGEEGYPPVIPARTTLTFEIELLEIGDLEEELNQEEEEEDVQT